MLDVENATAHKEVDQCDQHWFGWIQYSFWGNVKFIELTHTMSFSSKMLRMLSSSTAVRRLWQLETRKCILIQERNRAIDHVLQQTLRVKTNISCFTLHPNRGNFRIMRINWDATNPHWVNHPGFAKQG